MNRKPSQYSMVQHPFLIPTCKRILVLVPCPRTLQRFANYFPSKNASRVAPIALFPLGYAPADTSMHICTRSNPFRRTPPSTWATLPITKATLSFNLMAGPIEPLASGVQELCCGNIHAALWFSSTLFVYHSILVRTLPTLKPPEPQQQYSWRLNTTPPSSPTASSLRATTARLSTL